MIPLRIALVSPKGPAGGASPAGEPAPLGRYTLSLADGADDAAVRALLSENALPGDIALSFEREPDSSIAASVEGDVRQTIVARERSTGRLAAIAARSVHRAFVNGHAVRIGYLGQLRIAEPFRTSRTLMSAGYAFCRALHDADPVPFYLTSVVSGNGSARRLLLDLLYRDAPEMHPAGRLVTVVARPDRLPASAPPAGITVHAGAHEAIADIVECLERNGRRHQFARVWTADDLLSPAGPGADRFVVARRDGRVVGCLACWDQRAFKQVRVRGYSPALRRWRWAVNASGAITGTPSLPAVGATLEMAHLSHVAVDDDSAAILRALMGGVRRVLPADVRQIIAGFAQDSPLLDVFRGKRHRLYESVLFTAAWPNGAADVAALDGRRPHPEIAVL